MRKTLYTRRKKGKGVRFANYEERLPFILREKYDLFDERRFWDDWIDWRDSMRNYPSIYKNKGKLRKKYFHIFKDGLWNVEEYIIIKRLKKWTELEKIRKYRKKSVKNKKINY